MNRPKPPLVAVSLDARWAAAPPDAIARAVGRLDAAGVDLVILGGVAPGLDPLVLAGWLAQEPLRAGLVPVVSTRDTLPFHAARALSALDVLTRAGSGWAPIAATREDEAEGDAQARAADFIEATCALWDSWDADALILDKASGAYLDPDRVRRVDYRGPVFQVMGPLNACRPPQGHPVLVQTDADPLWRATAGRTDVLLVGAAGRDAFAACRQTVTEAAGQARLLASLAPGDPLDQFLPDLESGLVDGVHLAPADAAGIDAIVQGLTSEPQRRGLRGPAPSEGSLRARLGLRDHANADPACRAFGTRAA